MVQKTRPVVIMYSPRKTDARTLLIVAPLTSQIRSLRGEFALGRISWLPKLSAVNLQGLASFDPARLIRKMGSLPPQVFVDIKSDLKELLAL
jgi:mRNA-degrading endonuclease toxin of MazEF toxin-antitoxin module